MDVNIQAPLEPTAYQPPCKHYKQVCPYAVHSGFSFVVEQDVETSKWRITTSHPLTSEPICKDEVRVPWILKSNYSYTNLLDTRSELDDVHSLPYRFKTIVTQVNPRVWRPQYG